MTLIKIEDVQNLKNSKLEELEVLNSMTESDEVIYAMRVLQQFYEQINSLPTHDLIESQWIDVKDRLPEHTDTFYVYMGSGVYEIARFYSDTKEWHGRISGDVLLYLPIPPITLPFNN